jgi:hypothetical protein
VDDPDHHGSCQRAPTRTINVLEGCVVSIHSLLGTSEAPASASESDRGSPAAIAKPPLDVGEPADCCCATAQVRVVLPPVASRATRPELHLCAHHYRKAAAGLMAAGADFYDARGQWLTSREHFWADMEGNSNVATQPSS